VPPLPELQELLQYLMEMRGSDLYVKVGAAPHVRVDGHLHAAPFGPIDIEAADAILAQIIPPSRNQEFADTGEADFAHSVAGLGRFRVNVYRQRGSTAMVFRRVIPGIPPWDQLGLPPVVERVSTDTRGLVIVSGPSGSGKTTTVSAILDRINETRPAHIVTIEDPVEFLHQDKQSIVSQREVGSDTASFGEALRRAMRQGADVIFVGQMRDVETLTLALRAAETGHLVFTTMRTSSATETVSQLIDYYPPHQQKQARQALASALRMVVSQRLLERADGKGRTPAVEVLVNTSKVYDCIVDAERQPSLDRIVAEGEYHGMQTFDQALLHLYKDGLVSFRDALSVATQPEDLRIALQSTGLPASY
jgi:twitching motility protein PilT